MPLYASPCPLPGVVMTMCGAMVLFLMSQLVQCGYWGVGHSIRMAQFSLHFSGFSHGWGWNFDLGGCCLWMFFVMWVNVEVVVCEQEACW